MSEETSGDVSSAVLPDTGATSEDSGEMGNTGDSSQGPSQVSVAEPGDSSSSKVAEKEQSVPEPAPRPTVMVEGKEYEVPEGRSAKEYGIEIASHQRFRAAAEKDRKARAILDAVEKAKTDPVLARQLMTEQFGISKDVFEKVLENYVSEEIEREQMSPEQRALREREIKIQLQEEAIAKQKQSDEQIAHQAEIKKQTDHYNKIIVDTLSKTSLPKTERTVAKLATYMREAKMNNLDYSPEQLAEIVGEDYRTDIGSFVDSMEGDQLLDWLGSKVINKIRKADLKRIRGRSAKVPKKIVDSPKSTPSMAAAEESIDVEEFRRRVNSKLEED